MSPALLRKKTPTTLQKRVASLQKTLPKHVQLIVVSKTQTLSQIQQVYDCGIRHFGENRTTALIERHQQLPKDIYWHMIGHLQRNKVRQISPFVHLIHSIDSKELLLTIDKEGRKQQRRLQGLLQIKISADKNKYGLSPTELNALIQDKEVKALKYVNILGLMGMASLTDNTDQITNEFQQLTQLFKQYASLKLPTIAMRILSMGMSKDYAIALKAGSNALRIGSAIFQN